MTGIRFIEFLLFLLIVRHVLSEEPQPVFREKGNNIEMGYCFGVDYIVVYRVAQQGDQLLGNSSDGNVPGAPLADLQGRTRITEDHNLLGLQITNLTHEDSGIYRRECWGNQMQVSQHTHHLSVCNKEIESEEITVKEEEEGGGAELWCNSTLIGQEGISVHWYHEMYPNYKLTLFLDTSVSMKPLVEDQVGVLDVRDKGALLVLDDTVLKNNHHFYCLVIKGSECLSYQNMYPPDHSDAREIFASHGDKVVLECPVDGQDQQWDTPLGKINGSSMTNKHMHMSSESEDFSLVLPAISDEHSGEYSCISSTLEILYTLVLCPRKEFPGKSVNEGGTIALECSLDEMSSHSVQWYHYELSGEEELIQDTKDQTIATSQDLRGRLILSEDGSSLTIIDVKMSDGGEYFCVVLKNSEILNEDGDYTEEYEGEDTEGANYTDGDYWSHTQRCLLKQVTVLSIGPKRAVTIPPSEPSEGSNVAVIAALVGLVGLVLVSAIIVGIVLKIRAQRSPKQGQVASKGHTKAEIQLNRDPGCTEKLRNDDNFL